MCEGNYRTIQLSVLLSFLEYLVVHRVSVHMLVNYISDLKAICIVHNISPAVLEHQQVKYFSKSIRINRPVFVALKNIIDIRTLNHLMQLEATFKDETVLKAMFLVSYFGFFLLSKVMFFFQTKQGEVTP